MAVQDNQKLLIIKAEFENSVIYGFKFREIWNIFP